MSYTRSDWGVAATRRPKILSLSLFLPAFAVGRFVNKTPVKRNILIRTMWSLQHCQCPLSPKMDSHCLPCKYAMFGEICKGSTDGNRMRIQIPTSCVLLSGSFMQIGGKRMRFSILESTVPLYVTSQATCLVPNFTFVRLFLAYQKERFQARPPCALLSI